LGSSISFKIKTITTIKYIQVYWFGKKINNNEFVKTPVENKEKGFEKVLDNNKLEMKIIAYRHLMEFKKYMEAVN
jgi:hypothetical protein